VINETVILVILAIGLHYLIEEMKDMGGYTCPYYCGVDHIHKIEKREFDEILKEESKKESKDKNQN
jgi:hypothetical protein